MCLECYESYGAPRIATDATRHAARLIEAADKFGALHCVVEDENYDDPCLAACRSDPFSPLTPLDEACLEALEALSLDERVAAGAIANGDIPAYPSSAWPRQGAADEQRSIAMNWREEWPPEFYGNWESVSPDLLQAKIDGFESDTPLMNPDKASAWPR